ncbi:MAG: BufA1 family periplasmic bufferin-type metallophore [Burkholderiales bacterium]
MKKRETIMRSAIAGVLALGISGQAMAGMAKGPQMMQKGWEACGGVARAGMNDCGVKTSLHSCAGQAKKDGEADSYIYLPKGQCNRIVGGHVLNVTNADVGSLKEKMMKMMGM